MTWYVTDGGYELFFNRDERLSRSRAELPTMQNYEGVRYLSPTDPDAGGTWIAANHFGVTVCLLNHYQFEQLESYKQWTSRGEIVRQFASVACPVTAELEFLTQDLQDYRAFRMFVIDSSGTNRLCIWDGHQARVERNVVTPKSSSSVDAMYVKTLRKQLFSELNLQDCQDSKRYLEFHAGHVPHPSKESVCMHRPDAKTVSLSHIRVTSEQVEFAYADGSPCEAALAAPLTLGINPVVKLASVDDKNSAINF